MFCRPLTHLMPIAQVTSEILGLGSCGTIVFRGTLDGRQVAVKRILRQFNELADKEIAALIVSDEVPLASSNLAAGHNLPTLPATDEFQSAY